MMKNYLLILTTISILGACSIISPINIVEYDKVPTTKNQNVCKTLDDSVLVYAIFVDVDIYHPWTEFDIETTMDSLNKATSWIEAQAGAFNKPVNFNIIQHKQGSKWVIKEKSARASLSLNGLRSKNCKDLKKLNPWAEGIAAYAGKGLKYQSSQKMATTIRIKNKESLMLALRDKYKYENVSLLFFVNGYYEDHPSYTFYSATNGPNIEYSIITSKNPAVISHEILHLFGAVDLYPNSQYPNFNYVKITQAYPNEIMRIQHKELRKLTISPITAYFVGWQDTLDDVNQQLLLHKKMLTEY